MRKQKIYIAAGIAAVLIAAFLIIFWPKENIAQSEAERVLDGYAKASVTKFFCDNGYPPGIDNQRSWWDVAYVGESDPSRVAHVTEGVLRNAGYEFKTKFVGNSKDKNNEGKTYVEIKGNSGTIEVTARISSKSITHMNCFDYSQKNNALNPNLAKTVVVIKFRSTRDGF